MTHNNLNELLEGLHLPESGVKFWNPDVDGPVGVNPCSVTVWDAPEGGYNVEVKGTTEENGEDVYFVLWCPTLEISQKVAGFMAGNFVA